VRLLKVNEVARELGCSESWLRRSEQRGRIPKARRDINGWRVYTDEDVNTLRQILFPEGVQDRTQIVD
jgi:DNA-binding transcriptional MerR regulator